MYIVELEEKNNILQLTINNLESEIEKFKTYELIYKDFYSKNLKLLAANTELSSKMASLKTENENLKFDIKNLENKYVEYKTLVEQVSKSINLDVNGKITPEVKQELPDDVEKIPELPEKIAELYTINGVLEEIVPEYEQLDKYIKYGVPGIAYFLITTLYENKQGRVFYVDNKNRSVYNKLTGNLCKFLKKNMTLIKNKSDVDLKKVFWLFAETYNKEMTLHKYVNKYQPSPYVLFDRARNYYYYLKYESYEIDGHKYYTVNMSRDIDGEYIRKNWYPHILEYILKKDLPDNIITYYKKVLSFDDNLIIRDMKRRMFDDKYTYILNRTIFD